MAMLKKINKVNSQRDISEELTLRFANMIAMKQNSVVRLGSDV